MHPIFYKKNIHEKNHPGAILIMILGIVFLLSLIVTEFIGFTFDELQRRNDFAGNHELRIEAYNTVQLILATIENYREIKENLYSPNEKWGKPNVEIIQNENKLNRKIVIKIEDETGKLSLRKPDEGLLKELFISMDISEGKSQELVDSLIDWIDVDNNRKLEGAEKEYYEELKPSYPIGNQNLMSHESVFFIKGFSEIFKDEDGKPNEKFEKFKLLTSLYNQSEINLNTINIELVPIIAKRTGLIEGELKDLLFSMKEEDQTYPDKIINSLDNLKKTMNEDYQKVVINNCRILNIDVFIEEGERTFRINFIAEAPISKVKEKVPDKKGTNDDKEVKKPQNEKKEDNNNKTVNILMINENNLLSK